MRLTSTGVSVWLAWDARHGCGEPGYDPNDGPDVRELQAAFHRVQDPQDWKAPIDKVLPRNETERSLQTIATAIWYFTATQPQFQPTPEGVRVTAPGYRAGPAGDH